MAVLQPQGAIQQLPSYSNLLFTPDGKSIVGAQSNSDAIVRMSLATGQTTGSWQVTSRGDFDITPDGRYLLTAGTTDAPVFTGDGYSETIRVNRLDLRTGEIATFSTSVAVPTAPFTTPTTIPGFYDVAALTDGTAILTRASYAAQSLPLYSFDVASGSITPGAASYASPAELTMSGDHSHALLAPSLGGANALYVYSSGAGITASHAAEFPSNASTPRPQAISSSGALSVAAAATGAIPVYNSALDQIADLGSLHPEFFTPGGGQIVGLAFSPDDKILYLLDGRSTTIFELSTTDWSIVGSIELGIDYNGGSVATAAQAGHALQASSDGHYLLVGNELVDLTKAVVRTDFDGANTLSTASGMFALYGFGGNDTLIGDGAPTLIGGAGDDSYYSTATSSVGYGTRYYYANIIEQPNGGIDTLFTENGILAANVENIVGTSTTGNRLVGNDMANILTGNIGGDVFISGGGADTIITGGGPDRIEGSRSGLAGDTINGLQFGDTITITDQDAQSQFAFTRTGSTLNVGGDANITLSGLTGGHFTVQFFGGYPYGLYGSVAAGAVLTYRPSTADLSDFNGDGHSDLLWRNTSGALSTWSGSSAAGGATPFQMQQNTAYVAGTPTTWVTIGAADFNGDGTSDIIWHDKTGGRVAVWDASRGTFDQESYLSGSNDLSWTPGALGDFNGDGRGDILWRNSGSQVSAWTSTGTSYLQNSFYDQVDKSWHIQGVGDFNGDGRDDILWRNSNGALSMWSGTATGFAENSYSHAAVTLSAHVAGVGDLDGDGKADILWRNDNGTVFEWRSTGSSFVDDNTPVAGAGQDWHIAALADLNADGRDDAVWRNDNGTVSVWASTGNNFNQDVFNVAHVDTSWSNIHQQFDIV